MPASTRHRMGERMYVVAEGDTLFDIAKYEVKEAHALDRDLRPEPRRTGRGF